MKKTEWPIRWDLLLRYRLIEIIALWEGRLTTNHICHSFGIGRQQASKDINTYLRELAPNNLVYDRHLKGYIPADGFKPVVTQGLASEYLDLVSRHQNLSQTFESLDIGLPNSHLLRQPQPLARPELVRPLIAAIRQGRQLSAVYMSLDTPNPEHGILEPHTLVCSDRGWHVRGWCHNRQDYRDFLVTRFRAPMALLAERSEHTQQRDEQWNRRVTLVLQPNQRLDSHQRALIAHDYGMPTDQLRLDVRAALVPHLLRQMGLGPESASSNPLLHPLEVATEITAPQVTDKAYHSTPEACY
ncbi:WYL domain-containing protein [Marinobacter zhejiangensis]|uniref:Predicted DNA-binding transcriptional regulator YafY, contains an HTH and WYL domains n=1 Tax=Marinobacter zhejiangensis TaxID=488535 RepID=A0A1I4LYG3_9GAMM|nr:WYL domain-containing protein [Marinobacter zhejiangensis]SFL95959.1 Predicted DNA-binding transcriptional regulator YafY, contains an HTH and WYL domains [Marinobacter zhejiangensis]